MQRTQPQITVEQLYAYPNIVDYDNAREIIFTETRNYKYNIYIYIYIYIAIYIVSVSPIYLTGSVTMDVLCEVRLMIDRCSRAYVKARVCARVCTGRRYRIRSNVYLSRHKDTSVRTYVPEEGFKTIPAYLSLRCQHYYSVK